MKKLNNLINKMFGKKPEKVFFKVFYIGSIFIYIYTVVVKLFLILKAVIVKSIVRPEDIFFLLIIIYIYPLLVRGIINLTYFSSNKK